jgi:hypothetical protein
MQLPDLKIYRKKKNSPQHLYMKELGRFRIPKNTIHSINLGALPTYLKQKATQSNSAGLTTTQVSNQSITRRAPQGVQGAL